MSMIYDNHYEEWQPGDFVVWEEDMETPVQITSIDNGRVFWKENGEIRLTRATNRLRVKEVSDVTTDATSV